MSTDLLRDDEDHHPGEGDPTAAAGLAVGGALGVGLLLLGHGARLLGVDLRPTARLSARRMPAAIARSG